MDSIIHPDHQSSGFDLNRMWIVKVHRTVIFIWNQFCRRSFRFYSDLDHILFMGCEIKGTGFASRFWDLTGLFTQTCDRIIKQLGEIPCSLHHAASVSPLCLHWITSSIHSSRERPGARLLLIMKPPNIVTVHFLSTKWSKKLFTINHYELQNGKCIVTQKLSAY